MSHDTQTRRFAGNEFVPPIDQRDQRTRPTARPAPDAAYAPPPAAYDPGGYDPAPPAAPPPPAAAPVSDSGVVHLSRGYQAHDLDDVRSIRLRRPVTREIKRCGNPVRFDTDAQGRVTNFEIKWDVIAAYIPLLATPPIPSATVDEFIYEDLDACAAVIVPFFVKAL